MWKIIVNSFLLLAITLTSAWAGTDKLVIYSGRSEALVAPLIKKFEEKTGIKVDVRYNSTPTLATQLLHEGKNTPADVVFFQESGYLHALAKAGLLEKLDNALVEQVSPRFRDEEGYWVGTSGRLRVLAYNTNLVKPAELPKNLQELSDPKWKGKVGWAPSNASAQAHINALRLLWGEEETKRWLQAMKANEAVSYAKNSQIVSAVGKGEILLGWVNHYYLYELKKQNPDLPVANYNFPKGGEAGNLLIVSGGGIVKNSTHQAAAKAFLNFLLSEEIQQIVNKENFEYPTRMGSDDNKTVSHPLAKDIPLAKVSQVALANNLASTLTLLQSLNLL